MIQVKVFGTTPPCVKCKEVEKRARNAAEKFGDKVEVLKFDAMAEEGNKYGVMLTPTIVVDDKVIAVGKVLSESDIEKAIQKKVEGSR